MPQNCTLKIVKMVNFTLRTSTAIEKLDSHRTSLPKIRVINS